MYSLKERFANLHIDVVNTLFTEEAPEDYYNKSLYYIAKSIEIIGKVDAVYFTKDWRTSRGCRIERQVAREYGVKILEWDFLEDDKEELIRGGWTQPPKIAPDLSKSPTRTTPADMWPERPIITCSDRNLKGENLDIWQE